MILITDDPEKIPLRFITELWDTVQNPEMFQDEIETINRGLHDEYFAEAWHSIMNYAVIAATYDGRNNPEIGALYQDGNKLYFIELDKFNTEI